MPCNTKKIYKVEDCVLAECLISYGGLAASRYEIEVGSDNIGGLDRRGQMWFVKASSPKFCFGELRRNTNCLIKVLIWL
jgi:hypothetical protein